MKSSRSQKAALSAAKTRSGMSQLRSRKEQSSSDKGANVPHDSAKSAAERRVDEFLAALKTQRNASEHTVHAYQKDLAKFINYAGKGLDWRRVEHLTIRGYLSELLGNGLSKPSTALALASLRSFYKWMGREGHVKTNPAALVSTPKLPKKLP